MTDRVAEVPRASDGLARPAAGTADAFAEVLAEVLGVERVSPEASFFDDLGADSMVMARFCARVRKRADLPPVSMKDVYQHPTISRLAAALADTQAPAAPASASALAAILGEVLQTDQVPVDAHFFDDLGADSMVMARFCARVRKRADLPPVSMKDVYRNPTISALAAALGAATSDPLQSAVFVESSAGASGSESRPQAPKPVSTAQYVLCGAIQLMVYLGYAFVSALATVRGYEWVTAGSGPVQIYLRAVLFGGFALLVLSLVPIVAKWLLVGRWKPGAIPVWSLRYARFWVVKTLVRMNPVVFLFAGSPLYVLYLKALGAKIGRGVVILSRTVPVCTDLLTIGDGTVIRKDSLFTGYRALAGVIETGSVTLGRDVVISEATVLDIDTSMGDGAALGHASSLQTGQAVPAGESWHGSPAQRAGTDYREVRGAHVGTVRRAVYSCWQLVCALVVYLPLALGGVDVLLAVPQLTALQELGAMALTSWVFFGEALVASFVLFFGTVLLGLAVVLTVPRLLDVTVEPEKVYRLYGFHYAVHRTIARVSNSKFLTNLFGDSSYIVPYLRALGYDLSRVVQTGSNFGVAVKHETPFLSTVGSGTMVADGLSMMNASYSSTSFRVSRTSVGPRNFLGNHIAFPAQAKTGDNCLLATKVMVPVDGSVREGVGLLGSPAFEIPRSVERDGSFDHLSDEDVRHRLAAKNRYNRRTIAVFLLVRWVNVFLTTSVGLVGAHLYPSVGAVSIAAALVLSVLFTFVYSLLVERASTRFRALTPQFCSIYDPYFWWHERFWKLLANPALLNGTPFKTLFWRLAGVRIGRRVFDDGSSMPERTLVTIGDHATLNAGSVIQCHSQEDGAFKSDRITVGAGCTVGVGAWVHYGTSMGDGAVLAADSFLMKGEQVPANARWGGNPAGQLPGPTASGRRDAVGQLTGAPEPTGARKHTGRRPDHARTPDNAHQHDSGRRRDSAHGHGSGRRHRGPARYRGRHRVGSVG